MKKYKSSTLLLLFLAFCTACSSVKPPDTLATQARERIKQAESIGAQEGAPLELREATQYLSEAEKSMKNDRHEEAQFALEKSLISSELAIARTNSQKAQKAGEEIEKNLDVLRRETAPNTQTNFPSDEL